MAIADRHSVTAIVVTHDGETWLPAVVAALASQTRPINQIVAVDTGSEDSSTKLLKSARIPVISAPRDCGFGNAVALAVQQMPSHIEGSSEWIWLIHDDCAPAPTALEKLLEAIDQRPQVAMVGPKLLGWHDRTHLLEAGISIAGNGARWTGLELLEYDQGQHDGVHDVLSVSTAGALIRRDIFEEMGGFDPNLSLFRDDIDFGWRARVAGHAVIATTDAVAYHAQASATERRSVDVDGALLHRPLLLDRRNAAYVLLANSSWWMLPWLIIQLLGSAMARSIGYLLAKLPGYAGDELLAIVTLIIKPAIIVKARKERKAKRLVSARVISAYIPPRWSQIRLSASRAAEVIRARIIPEAEISTASVLDSLEDEDLL
ncbi:MAG: glycosyltransferase, partial [Actinobacteria bacterium]|nr:glycosyltransferase [Actinomycetota bacterium]